MLLSLAVAGALGSAAPDRAIAQAHDAEPPRAPVAQTQDAAPSREPVAQTAQDTAGPSASEADVPRTTEPRYRVSPTSATLQSMVVPGLGQVRAGAPVRGAIAFALESYLVTTTLIEHDRAGDDRDREDEARAAGDVDAANGYAASAENHEQRRSEFLFWTGIAHMFNMLDAYIAAHLSLVEDEIDSVQRLTFNASATPGGGETLALTWSF